MLVTPQLALLTMTTIQVVELRNYNSAGAYAFLKALIEEKAPKAGLTLSIQYINPQVILESRVEF